MPSIPKLKPLKLKTISSVDELCFDKNGLIPAVIQEETDNRVLMVAYMNKISLQKTLQTRLAHYWSRSRGCFWLKGETSGHFQKVQKIYFDCDSDTLLIKIRQTGAACHTGKRSCFYRRLA